MYSPAWGRWLSRDTIAENGGINLYHYCYNNPVSYRDRLGLAPRNSVPPGNRPPPYTPPGPPPKIPTGAETEAPDLFASDAASHDSQVSYEWALQNAEKGCGRHTGCPNCHCCIQVLYYASFEDGNDLYDWKSAYGHLVNKGCEAAQADANKNGVMIPAPPAGSSSSTILYSPW